MTDSEQIDQSIRDLNDWRAVKLSTFRELVNTNFPELTEELKWGVGVFTYEGSPVVASSAFRDHTKYNFFHGASLDDPARLFNSGLDSKSHRSINLSQSDTLVTSELLKMLARAVEFSKNK